MQFIPMAAKLDSSEDTSFAEGEFIELAKFDAVEQSQEVCCGGAPPPKSHPLERPGYSLKSYVRAFIRDNSADVAIVRTELDFSDWVGTLLARLGVGRENYTVAPGLYGTGHPDSDSPVIVTANYKLTFDTVRRALRGIDCWLLVLDTCGINVWCAAGKHTFSTSEIVQRVEQCSLSTKVNHRRLIVPQLGATGVAAHEVRLKSGFRVVYGPVRATDLAAFLKNEMQATEEMKAVTFTLWERFVLIPVEFYLFSKKIWWIFPLIFILSGLSHDFFSLSQAWRRGLLGSAALVLGGVSGAMIVPLFLPWIPGRSFSLKGVWPGVVLSLILIQLSGVALLDRMALVLAVTSVSSYLAMNFTGSTPYTSPSGVEKEMKRAIPLQALAVVVGTFFWLISPFL